MSNETRTFGSQQPDLPPDLLEVASRLDALGAAVRADAPAGFEARIAARARAAHAPSVEAPSSLPFPVSLTRSGGSWRMAAAIALCAGLLGGATWVATRTPAGPTGIAVQSADGSDAQEIALELEQFLASAESWDLGVSQSIASTREAINEVSGARDFWGDDSSDSLQLEESL